MTNIRKAMILAAGLGRRLQPLTDTTPKPLVQVNGKALIDYAMDLVRVAGLKHVVLNCHHLADQIEAYAATVTDLDIQVSDERSALLETGGGVQKALPLLGDAPFAILNSDVIVKDDQNTSLKKLMDVWQPQAMDVLMLLQHKDTAVGYEGRGDFHLDAQNRLLRRRKNEDAPFIFSGIQIINPDLFNGIDAGRFSMNVLFDKAVEKGRLFGAVHEGMWLHVGTVSALKEAEGILSGRA